MSELLGVLLRQRGRILEIVEILARYGLVGLADKAAKALDLSGGATSRQFLVTLIDPKLADWTTGERLAGVLGKLGPTWIKLGQTLSVRADLVGVEIARDLTKLQSAVPPDAPGHAEELIAAELGRPVEEVFASFSPTPMASGSVAQVHRATTWDGVDVAVKVLHHDVERRVIGDLELMAALAELIESVDPVLARLGPVQVVAQFDAMMRAAINLQREARNLERFRKRFADESDIAIPTPFPQLSSHRVLTMELMTGERIDDLSAIASTGWKLQDLVHRATTMYLDMIFRDGIYHADPNPGNLLVRPDALIVLDFGDIGTLTASSRNHLESLLLAVARGNTDDLVDAILDITDAPASTQRSALANDVSLLMGPYLQEDSIGPDIAGFVETVLRIVHRSKLRLPPDLAMVLRVLSLLQGVSARLGADVDFVALIKPYVIGRTRRWLNPRELSWRALRSIRGWDALLTRMPDDLGNVFDRFQDGSLDINVELHDSDDRIDQLVDGLFSSALSLGAAGLISRETKPLVAGVSVPGAIAALLAAASYQQLRRRRASHRTLATRASRLARSVVKAGRPR